MRLYVAMLRGDNETAETRQLRGLGKAVEQMVRLRRAIVASDRFVRGHAQNDKYHALFVAPEYFFANQRSLNDRFFQHGVKRWIMSALSAVAEDFPRLLIIPGTVLWTKQVSRGANDPKSAARVDRVKARYGAVSGLLEPRRAHIENVHGEEFGDTSFYVNAQSNEPGWTHEGRFARYENDTVTPSFYLGAVGGSLIAQNTAYVAKGKTILKYHKVGNSAEVHGEGGELVFAPGSIAGTFKMGDVRYGLEVCMDHWLGVLSGSGAAPVHVQVITSSSTPNRAFHYHVRSGGLLVHSSTDETIDPFVPFGTGAAAPKLVRTEGLDANLEISVFDLDDTACGIKSYGADDALKSISGGSADGLMASTLSPVHHRYENL
jgi:predicted amidohydrolase